MTPNSTDIKYLESLVTGIKEVTGCRIVTGVAGEISEVHVTATSDRLPRLIARDVDTILKVKGNLDIDHRKIQVAMEIDPPELDPDEDDLIIIEDEGVDELGSPAPSLEGDLPPGDERVLYEKLTVTHSEGAVSAAVQLRHGERRVVGETEAADTPDGHLAAVIHATLDAMLMLHESGMRFHTPRFDRIRFGRDEVLVVYLEAVEGRDLHRFTGSALVQQDLRQSAVLATLSATNRLVGLWAAREQLDFDIL